jgi:SAM-dependent methyltransferase
MKDLTDSRYLQRDQYRTSANLDRRSDLHARFSVNPYGWHSWVFDQLDLPDDADILELGCGPAYLWAKNSHRLPDGWSITLTDFSRGMVGVARKGVGSSGGQIRYAVSDATAIPFPESTFDAVIANHMLYHVLERDRALRDVSRVLKPGGTLYAATNGRTHLRELFDLANQFDPERAADGRGGKGFGLQNGGDQLARHFTDVSIVRYEDGLIVTELDGLLGWAESWAPAAYGPNRLSEFYAFLTDHFRANDPLHIAKESGIFIARNP